VVRDGSFRLVTLALRDWRVPIHAEVGWFALALGLEVMVAAGATDEWRGPLLLFVPLFFVAALASRASTVWTSGGAGELDERVRAAWIRRALIATGALVGAMAAAVILSVEGGVFDRIGVWLTPAANAVASFFAWVLSQAARPIFFLVDLLGCWVPGVRGDRLCRVPGDPALPATGRRRARAPRPGDPDRGGAARGRGASPRPRFRRERPADAVRRWYAEALWALRRREIVREPWQTPAEFAPVVAGAVPSCADAFAELTRAYEDVRYGSLRLDPTAILRLEAASSGSCLRSAAAEPRASAGVDPGLPAPAQERFRRFDEFGARTRSPRDVGRVLRHAPGRIGVTHGFGSERGRGV
jgi:hypothetical protein